MHYPSHADSKYLVGG